MITQLPTSPQITSLSSSSPKLFKKVETLPNSEPIKSLYTQIENRLGPKPIKSLNLSEIQQVAEIVDEYLKHHHTTTNMTSASDTRVAPATSTHQKRQQAYEQPPQNQHPPPLSRTNTSSTIQGIYTLPDPEDPKPPAPTTNLNLQQQPPLSSKLVSNLLGLIQIILILIFGVFISYDENNVSAISKSYIESLKPTKRPNYDQNFYNPNNYNDREPPPPLPPSYNPDQEGRYGNNGPYAQPVTNTPVEYPNQNLHQYYYCK